MKKLFVPKKKYSWRGYAVTAASAFALTTAGWWFANRLDLTFGQLPDVNAVGNTGVNCTPGEVKEGDTVKEETKDGVKYKIKYYKCVVKKVFPKKVIRVKNGERKIVDAKDCKESKKVTKVEYKTDKKGNKIAKPIKKEEIQCIAYKGETQVLAWEFDHSETQEAKNDRAAKCSYKGTEYNVGTVIKNDYVVKCKEAHEFGQNIELCNTCTLSCAAKGRLNEDCNWQQRGTQ